MDAAQLKSGLANSAFAFRGYNLTNLGRTNELLAHPRFGPIVADCLERAAKISGNVTGRTTDLVGQVRENREAGISTYGDALALVVAVEIAQLRILDECFDIPYSAAKLAFGYSLGEIAALVAGGVIPFEEGIRIPVSVSDDCAKLSGDVTLAVLFSLGPELNIDEIQRQCLLVNCEGNGVVGLSAILTPNSVLLMGQGDTLDRVKKRIDAEFTFRVHLRKNDGRWPPLHTPIVWQRHLPSQAAMLMHTMKGGFTAPRPPVFSLVTGSLGYNGINTREILCHWTDHPQRLWEAIYETLKQGIETVIHVGPEPNLIPATYTRLRVNVEAQTKLSMSMRALSVAVSRPWLAALLPKRAALLRVLTLKQINLEDWLLENAAAAQ